MHHAGRAGSTGKQWAAKSGDGVQETAENPESQNQEAGTDGNH